MAEGKKFVPGKGMVPAGKTGDAKKGAVPPKKGAPVPPKKGAQGKPGTKKPVPPKKK